MTRSGFLFALMIIFALVMYLGSVACDDTTDCDQDCFDEWDKCWDTTVPNVDNPNHEKAIKACDDQQSECEDECEDNADSCG